MWLWDVEHIYMKLYVYSYFLETPYMFGPYPFHITIPSPLRRRYIYYQLLWFIMFHRWILQVSSNLQAILRQSSLHCSQLSNLTSNDLCKNGGIGIIGCTTAVYIFVLQLVYKRLRQRLLYLPFPSYSA